MPEICWSAHPDDPEVHCEKDAPCYTLHTSYVAGKTWKGNPRPTATSKKAKAAEIAQSVKGAETTGPAVPTMTATQATNEAIGRIEANTPDEWKAAALDAIRTIALKQPEMVMEDAQELLGIDAHDNRAWGPVTRRAVSAGLIEKCVPEKFVTTRYVRRHQMEVRVWRSLVYKPQVAPAGVIPDFD